VKGTKALKKETGGILRGMTPPVGIPRSPLPRAVQRTSAETKNSPLKRHSRRERSPEKKKTYSHAMLRENGENTEKSVTERVLQIGQKKTAKR